MSTYLLEIGTEELPAGYINEAQERLKELMSEALKTANLDFASLSCLSTPRRLALTVTGLPELQSTTTKKVKGPPAEASFNADGTAKPAAAGFASKHGLTVAELDREQQGATTYLIANVTTKGKAAAEVLSEIVPKVIAQLSGERMMRWGSSDFKFSRPIRWLVSLMDEKVVAISVEGIEAGRQSWGHRILSPKPVTIGSPESYAEDLHRANVLVNPEERRQIIIKQVTELAASLGGRPRQLSGPLLDEVVNITEWPKAIVGDFASEYLDLPDALIETVMVHHQKYFPVERELDGNGTQKALSNNRLLPNFIAVSNNDRAEASAHIKQGNERVLRARLADGRFFYFDDQKVKLTERRHALSQLSFQQGLGSYLDKVERMVQAANKLSATLQLDSKLKICLERTLELCKCDLVSNLVRELPELQGYVGAWYAEREGEPPAVVAAIPSHYQPRSTEDQIPADDVGQFAALIDKTDNLVGLFALGKKPSGSSDPFALRRQGQGLIDILMNGLKNQRVDLTALVADLLKLYQPWLDQAKKRLGTEATQTELAEFLLVRVRANLSALVSRKEVVEAVLANRDALKDLPDLIVRSQIMDKLAQSEPGIELIRAGVRIGNILKEDIDDHVDSSLFSEEAESELWRLFNENLGQATLPTAGCRWTDKDYEHLIEKLRPLAKPVDTYFEKVMVNDPDAAKRKNRHAMLSKINRHFKAIADFPKLQPLIP
jgi:glycyl-tRNA synthetase beta chain